MGFEYARPSTDVAAGGWTPSTGTDLAPMLDEVAVDDADFIISAENPNEDTCKMTLAGITYPGSGTVTLSVRACWVDLIAVAFIWSAEAGATSYVLQVGPFTGSYTTFNANVGDVLTYSLFLAPGTYYSRVVPQGAGSATAERGWTLASDGAVTDL